MSVHRVFNNINTIHSSFPSLRVSVAATVQEPRLMDFSRRAAGHRAHRKWERHLVRRGTRRAANCGTVWVAPEKLRRQVSINRPGKSKGHGGHRRGEEIPSDTLMDPGLEDASGGVTPDAFLLIHHTLPTHDEGYSFQFCFESATAKLAAPEAWRFIRAMRPREKRARPRNTENPRE